jgi:hypothetical protein
MFTDGNRIFYARPDKLTENDLQNLIKRKVHIMLLASKSSAVC